MKNDHFAEMLEELQECGINFNDLARQVGYPEGYLCVTRAKKNSFEKESHLLLAIEKRIRLLKNFSFSKHNLDELLNKVGLRENIIAEELGISRQALNRQKKLGIPQERKRKIEKTIKEIASSLEYSLNNYFKKQKIPKAA